MIKMKNGYLLVKPLPTDGDQKSGIWIPVESDAEAQTSRCEVMSHENASEYKKGDIVFFSKLVPDNIVIDGEELWFVREEDIKATE